MRTRTLWALAVAITSVVNVNAGTLTPSITSAPGTLFQETGSEDANREIATTEGQSEVFDDVVEEAGIEGSFGNSKNKDSLPGYEAAERSSSDEKKGTEHHEKKRSVHHENISTSGHKLKSTSGDESDPSSTSTVTLNSQELTTKSSRPPVTQPPSASHNVIDSAFPQSREPEQKEETGPRQLVGQVIKFINDRLGLEQKLKSVIQVLFFHIYIISFFYLFVVIHQGVMSVIDMLRTPLLIYKEVDSEEEMKAVPAPTMPPLHKDYGYTGGFKTPKGQKIEYMPYPAPKPDPNKPKDPPKTEKPEKKPEKPSKSEKKPDSKPKRRQYVVTPNVLPYQVQNNPPKGGPHGLQYVVTPNVPPYQVHNNPPGGGPHGSSFAVFHELQNRAPYVDYPQLPGGDGDEVSSYVSYAGEQQ